MSATAVLFQRYGDSYRWWVLLTITLGTLAAIFSSTVTNMAIPAIMQEFAIQQDLAHWLTTGFLVSVPMGMLVAGWLTERWGQKRVWLASLAIFIITSLLAAQSSYFAALVAYRILQGLVAGVVQPLSVLAIFHVFPVNQRGFAMGIYGFGAVIGPASAPILGGVFVDMWGWASIFILPIPVLLLTMALGVLFMAGRDLTQKTAAFDWQGLALLLLVWMLHLWCLNAMSTYPWFWQLLLMAGFVVGLGLLIKHQLHRPSPLLALQLFRYPLFGIGFVLSALLGVGLFASTYVAVLFFQQAMQKSAAEAGFMLLPAGGVMALTFPIAGYLSDHWPFYRLVMLGLLMFVLAMFAMWLTPLQAPLWLWMVWVVFGRMALGLLTPPLGTVPLQYLPVELLSQGAGIMTFARQWGAVLGVSGSALFIQFMSESSSYWGDESQRFLAYEKGFNASFLALSLVFGLGLLMCIYAAFRWPQQAIAKEGKK